jgi:hypothetical protein
VTGGNDMDTAFYAYLLYFLACTLLGMWLQDKITKLEKLKKQSEQSDKEGE